MPRRSLRQHHKVMSQTLLTLRFVGRRPDDACRPEVIYQGLSMLADTLGRYIVLARVHLFPPAVRGVSGTTVALVEDLRVELDTLTDALTIFRTKWTVEAITAERAVFHAEGCQLYDLLDDLLRRIERHVYPLVLEDDTPASETPLAS